MTSEDLRVLDLDQNVAVCKKEHVTGTIHEAAMSFEEWCKEAEQMLMARHLDKDHWRQCFERN